MKNKEASKDIALIISECGQIPRWCAVALQYSLKGNSASCVGAFKLGESTFTCAELKPPMLSELSETFVDLDQYPFSSVLKGLQKTVANRNSYLDNAMELLDFGAEFPEIPIFNNLPTEQTADLFWWCAQGRPTTNYEQSAGKTPLWYWRFDGLSDGCGAGAGWVASMAKKGVVKSELVASTGEKICCISGTSSCVIPFSLSDNRSQVLWSAAQLTALAFSSEPKISRPPIPEQHLSLGLLFSFWLRKAQSKICWHVYYALFMDQWALHFKQSSLDSELLSDEVERGTYLVPAKHLFWADPHIVESEGKSHIFFEEFDHILDKGSIKHLAIDKDGQLGEPQTVLAPEFHVSYPHVFQFEGEFYMIPESEGEQSIKLYRSHNFPHDWRLEVELMSGVRAADSTLIYRDKQWWLFTTMSAVVGGSTAEHLYVFYADDFRTQNWTAVSTNPVISNSQTARMAGAFFEHEGKLYRPAQNCAWRYGYGLNIFRVDKLNETEYQETLVADFFPSKDSRVRGVHSLAVNGKLTVSDAELRRSKYRWLSFLDIKGK